MSDLTNIHGTDTRFKDSPDVGKDCICSRCGKPITRCVPVRVWPDEEERKVSGDYEYRFHSECLGMKVVEDPEEWDDDEDWDEWDDGMQNW